MSNQQLANKVAVIVGGTSGIGLASARAIHKAGAKVFLTGVDPERLREAGQEFGSSAVIAMDVRDLANIQRAVEYVRGQSGQVDILFANCGMGLAAPLGAVTETEFDTQVGINFKGLFFSVQKFVPLLRTGASVVLTTSFLNVVGTSGLSVLSATKAAVRSLARSFARELSELGIRVNAVSPGPIDTPFHGKLGLNEQQLQEVAADIQRKVPLHRFGEAAEVASAVVFLASNDSSYMTGAELVVDGGMSQI